MLLLISLLLFISIGYIVYSGVKSRQGVNQWVNISAVNTFTFIIGIIIIIYILIIICDVQMCYSLIVD